MSERENLSKISQHVKLGISKHTFSLTNSLSRSYLKKFLASKKSEIEKQIAEIGRIISI